MGKKSGPRTPPLPEPPDPRIGRIEDTKVRQALLDTKFAPRPEDYEPPELPEPFKRDFVDWENERNKLNESVADKSSKNTPKGKGSTRITSLLGQPTGNEEESSAMLRRLG